MVSVHDIVWNDVAYILEWGHGEDGYIMITEACDDPNNDDCGHDHEAYDFEEIK